MGNYLQQPNLAKHELQDSNSFIQSSLFCVQGWRINNEDSHIFDLKFNQEQSLFAIFDGHGGKEVSLFCSQNFPNLLKNDKNYKEENYLEALRSSLDLLDEQVCEISLTSQNDLVNAGCTAIICLLVKDVVYFASIGDCRGLLLHTSGQIDVLNNEHSPDESYERERIQKSGSVIMNGRINEQLNLTRAIGDSQMKKNYLIKRKEQAVSHEGFFNEIQIKDKHLALVLGCDGLYELLDNTQIRNILFQGLKENQSMSQINDTFIDRAITKNINQNQLGTDNVSCIIVLFGKYKENDEQKSYKNLLKQIQDFQNVENP